MTFDLTAFLPRAVMQGIPLLYGSTGEILTEKSGNLNLGIPGVMYVGGICGVIGAFFYEQSTPAADMNAFLAIGIPMLCSLLGSLLMGLLEEIISILHIHSDGIKVVSILHIESVLLQGQLKGIGHLVDTCSNLLQTLRTVVHSIHA